MSQQAVPPVQQPSRLGSSWSLGAVPPNKALQRTCHKKPWHVAELRR